MGGVIEDNARIMVALDKLGKNSEIGDLGLRLNDAAKHVWKYLYQYDQVTAFEHGGYEKGLSLLHLAKEKYSQASWKYLRTTWSI